MTMKWTRVCKINDLSTDVPRGFVVRGVAICLVHSCGEVFAVHNSCTHAAVPLSDGDVDDCAVECSMHGSRFDLRTGAVLNLPATIPVRTYPVRVVAGQVEIAVA